MKNLHQTLSQVRIDGFIQFYTNLSTRLSIAFGDDISGSHPARYLLQARSDFYSESRVTGDDIYTKLSPFLQYAVLQTKIFTKRRISWKLL